MATLDPAKREEILRLARAGTGRNDIARTVGVSGETVSRICKAAGVTFDRSAVQAATEARVADARARRAELALLLIEDAHRLRRQLWQPVEYIDHGGKDFDEARWVVDEPTFVDKRNILQAASVAVTASTKLDLHDRADQEHNDVDAWLDSMTGA